MLSIFSKQRSLVFSPTGVVSITTSTLSSENLGFCTMCLVFIHTNKMVSPNVSITTLSKLALLYLLMLLFLFAIVAMLLLQPVFDKSASYMSSSYEDSIRGFAS
jgi:hypothetical protein